MARAPVVLGDIVKSMVQKSMKLALDRDSMDDGEMQCRAVQSSEDELKAKFEKLTEAIKKGPGKQAKSRSTGTRSSSRSTASRGTPTSEIPGGPMFTYTSGETRSIRRTATPSRRMDKKRQRRALAVKKDKNTSIKRILFYMLKGFRLCDIVVLNVEESRRWVRRCDVEVVLRSSEPILGQ